MKYKRGKFAIRQKSSLWERFHKKRRKYRGKGVIE